MWILWKETNVYALFLHQVALLFSLWTETVRPYLEIVDEWIVHGHLFDPAKEFIIQRCAADAVKQQSGCGISSILVAEFLPSVAQKQRRASESQGLLVRHLHAVQRVGDGGE